uniref:Uncharacterized protein n=1 Tax=Anguilla anguilla TaxID=7936 RepID=A0A0E9SX10_ANGAN
MFHLHLFVSQTSKCWLNTALLFLPAEISSDFD